MPKTATLNVSLKKNDGVNAIALFIMDESDPEERMDRLSIGQTGRKDFTVKAPSRHKLIWHIRGKPGGKIELIVSRDGKVIGAVTPERSKIPDNGEKQNSGRVRLVLGATT